MDNVTLKVQRVRKHKDLSPPEIENETGALLLRSTWRGKIPGHSAAMIKTGVAVEIPKGFYGLIVNPDGLVTGYKLFNRTQTISTEYRNEISLYLVNFSPYPEPVEVNQVIGKLLILPQTEIVKKNVGRISRKRED
jgi:dUTPase